MATKKTITPTEKVKKSLVNRDKLLKEENLSNAVTAARKRKQDMFKK